jgi:hypothetical protein
LCSGALYLYFHWIENDNVSCLSLVFRISVMKRVLSDSNADCVDCTNCTDCTGCTDCSNDTSCTDCKGGKNNTNCKDCVEYVVSANYSIDY